MKLADELSTTRLSLDVTPLIDVVFLLVLFFALSSSFISASDLAVLRDAVSSLTRDRDDLSRRNEALAGELGTANARSAELETLGLALEARGLALEASLDSTGRQRDRLRDQLSRAVSELEKLDLDIVGLRSDAERRAQTDRALRTLLAERERAQAAALDDAEADQARLAAELERRSAALEASRGAVDRHAAQERLLQALLAERAAELEGLRVELLTVGETVATASDALDAARADNQRLAGRAAQAEAALTSREQRAASIEAALDRAAARANALERETDAQREQIGGHLRAADQLRDEAARLRTENLALRNRLGEMKRLSALDQAQIDRILAAEARLQAGLADDLASERVDIERTAQSLTLKLSDRILFDSGQATIKPDGLAVLRRVGALLRDRISGLDVRIGGHTDNVPVGGGTGLLSSNWGLSAARAVNVVRFLEEELGLASGSLAAVGFGEHHPVASNATAEGRALNRRIEIVLVPR